MTTIEVCASRRYDIQIGNGLLPALGRALCAVGQTGSAAIVSDSNVWLLYGEIAERSLAEAGFRTVHFVFPAGESSKNAQVYLDLLNFLAENHLTRSDCLIALGGGVVGDLTGFAAATYLRGLSYIQVPTTLLAAVDSSVGGKTAIDLPAGKNLAGAFHQPSLVLCDLDTLDSLPEDIFLDGCAEAIKYAVLFDQKLFDLLMKDGPAFPREAVIARCVELKRDVVTEDEFDTGLRMLLNLGHTLGHGVEAHSHYALSHGKAVAIGMALVARSAAHLDICGAATCQAIEDILQRFHLPTACPCTAAELYSAALSDKKRRGGTVKLIVPRRIGCCTILPTPVEALEDFIKAGGIS